MSDRVVSLFTGEKSRRVTGWNHLRAVLLLPVMNTVIIPSVLLSLFPASGFRQSPAVVNLIALCLALPIFASGLTLAVKAIWLFVRRGGGTLAPWDPTSVLIAADIYRYTRNPMKLGLFLMLISECVLSRSPALMIWTASFIIVNAIYIRVSEEPGLRKRFGAAYDDYCKRVPRWIGNFSLRAGHAVSMRGCR